MTETLNYQTTNPIRTRRLARGLTLRGMAALCGVSGPSVYLTEVGQRNLPAKLLRGYCDATGEAYEDLLEDWLIWQGGTTPTRAKRLECLIRMATSQASLVKSTTTEQSNGGNRA